MPTPEQPSVSENLISEIEAKASNPNAVRDETLTKEMSDHIGLLREKLKTEKAEVITKIRARFSQLKANINYSLEANQVESVTTETATATSKLKEEISQTDQLLNNPADEAKEGEQKQGEAQPQATEKLSFFGEIGQEFNVTMDKIKNAKSNGERFTIVMEALGNVWAKIQNSLSSMGSSTLTSMSGLVGVFAGKEAANFLRGIAGTEKAILIEQLKGAYVITPDIKRNDDKIALGKLQAKFAEYKKKKMTPVAAPAAPAASAPAATPAATTAAVATSVPTPTFEDFVAEVVVPKVETTDWSGKTKGEDGKLKLTLSEIVAKI